MKRAGKAAVYEAPNTPFIIKEYPLRPVKVDEVLVRVSMSTICRSDIHSYEGKRPNPHPGILGHEIIGTIVELGKNISKDMRGDPINAGDRITWSEYFYHGECYYREIHDMVMKTAAAETAAVEFTGNGTCGDAPVKSASIRSPQIVSARGSSNGSKRPPMKVSR